MVEAQSEGVWEARLRGAVAEDRRKEAAAAAAAVDSQMEAEEAEVCQKGAVGVVGLWTVGAEAEVLRRVAEAVDHDVSEKKRPWERQGRVELLLKSSTTSLRKTFH